MVAATASAYAASLRMSAQSLAWWLRVAAPRSSTELVRSVPGQLGREAG